MPFLIIVSVLWAFSFGLIGSTLAGLDSLFVATSRLALAWLCFLPFFRVRGLKATEIAQLAAIGALQFGVMYVCYIRAFAHAPSHLVALFSILTPLYIALAHDVMRRRWRWQLLGCATLSIAGAAVIKFARPEGDVWLSFGLMQIANLAFGLGQLLYREWRLKRPEAKDHQLMAALYAGAAATAGLAMALWGDLENLAPTTEQWGALAYLGVVASGVGFYLWNLGAARTQPGALAASNNAVVPLAMAVSLFVFGEAEQVAAASIWKLIVGAGLILASILWGRRLG